MSETSGDRAWSRAELAGLLVRYDSLIPCTTAFVDARTPGSDRKENFTIIGPGVAENPDQHVHIETRHGFNVGGARQPPRCVNSQHSHETAEVFVVHSGRWAFYLGETGEDAQVTLTPGDIISIPTRVFRGFENVGEDTGFLFAVLGGDDPGRVTWAPYVFAAAQRHGLVLLENGALVDLTQGQAVPADVAPMPPTSAAEVARMKRLDGAALRRCVARAKALSGAQRSLLSGPDIGEFPIIGDGQGHGLPAGKLNWPHGFHLRKLALAPGAETINHIRPQEEVLMQHSGALTLTVAEHSFTLGPGDLMSVPVGAPRRYSNGGDADSQTYIVDGGDAPSGFPTAKQSPSHGLKEPLDKSRKLGGAKRA